MQNLLALTTRELKSFFYSPIAYVVGAFFLFLQGFVFWLLVVALNDPRSDPSFTIAQAFFGPTFFLVTSLLILIPTLTMRTFSEEKRTGSIELLLTAPVTDAQVVLAKFLGAWIAYAFFWTLTLIYFLILRHLTPFDWGPVLTGYLSVGLVGAMLVAVGVLTSSLTRNQVIAAVLAFVVSLLFFCIGMFEAFIHDPDTTKVIQYLSLIEHLREFSKGVVDTRPVILYLSVTVIGLFLTGRVINSPRWRS